MAIPELLNKFNNDKVKTQPATLQIERAAPSVSLWFF
jgi:hypothetical protein